MRDECPLSEVRAPSQHPPSRTSESHGLLTNLLILVPLYRSEVPDRIRRLWSRDFRSAVLVKGDDFDPVRALACRVAPDQLERAGLGVDLVGSDHVRLLAGNDDEAAGRVDIETARLLLGRRAPEIGQLSACSVDAKGSECARCTLCGVKKATVRREVKIRRPDVIVGVPRGLVRAGRSDGSTRHTGDELRVRR